MYAVVPPSPKAGRSAVRRFAPLRENRIVALAVVAALGVSSCGDDGVTGPTADPPLQVSVSPAEVTVAVGETAEIQVEAQGGAPGAQTQWVCSTSAQTVVSTASSTAGCSIMGEDLGGATVSVLVTRGQESKTVTVAVTVEAPPPAPEPTTLSKVSGDGQTLVFEAESGVLVVEVLDQNEEPMAGVSVGFVGRGVAHVLSSASASTGADGRTAVTVTAGEEVGEIDVEATVAGLPAVVFTLAVSGPAPFTIPAPASTPRGVAWDGTYLWIVAGSDSTPEIYQIDPADGAVQQSFPAPAGAHRGLVWDGSHLWYSSHATARIYRLDPSDNGNVVLEFDSPGTLPRGIAWDGTHLWHNDVGGRWPNNTPTVYRLDATNGDVLGSIPSPVTDPLGLVWDGTHLWTAQYRNDRDIVRFDPESGAAVGAIANPGDLPLGLSVDPTGPWLWVSDMNQAVIYKLSLDP
jgi:hypothetical protein